MSIDYVAASAFRFLTDGEDPRKLYDAIISGETLDLSREPDLTLALG